MRVVVCDTGPILHLREANGLWLLETAGDVIAPTAVDRELEARLSDWTTERPAWLRVVKISEEDSRQAEHLRAFGDLGFVSHPDSCLSVAPRTETRPLETR